MSSPSAGFQRLEALAVNEDVLRETSGLRYLNISGQKWTKLELDSFGHMAHMAVCTAQYLITLFEFAQFFVDVSLMFHDVPQFLSNHNRMLQTAQLPVAPQRFGVPRQC